MKLTIETIDKTQGYGNYYRSDGLNGLFIYVTKSGDKRWVIKWKSSDKKTKQMLIGYYPEMSLDKAREIAAIRHGLQ